VAGGDVDGAQRVHVGDAERQDRRRHAAAREVHGDAVAGQHLGRGRREILGLESLVAADDRAALRRVRIGRLEIVRKALGAPPHVVEGVGVGHARAPTVRPEYDVARQLTAHLLTTHLLILYAACDCPAVAAAPGPPPP